jgi:hypothetical protein
MRPRMMHILMNLEIQYRPIIRSMQLPSIGRTTPKRTSNKSKLKMTKSKPNVKYKSSKPISSKVNTTFRNKSNL